MKSKLKRLHDRCWELISEYVRRKAQGRCFTCGIVRYWKKQDAGHCFHGKGDFNFINIQCQCTSCNRHKHGNGAEFMIRLIYKYGQGKVDNMIYEINKKTKYIISELEEIKFYLKQKIEELENDF